MIGHVLTVCVGNICRSPAAQLLLQQGMPGLWASSAGLQALDGQGVDPPMQVRLRSMGVDPSAHRARTLTAWMVRQADLVLVMDSAQQHHIEQQYPETRGRVFRLAHAQSRDIPDPYRQNEQVLEEVLDLIQSGVTDWTRRIQSVGYSPRGR